MVDFQVGGRTEQLNDELNLWEFILVLSSHCDIVCKGTNEPIGVDTSHPEEELVDDDVEEEGREWVSLRNTLVCHQIEIELRVV